MKAFIPELGTKLKLEKDWSPNIFLEYRNSDIFLADGKKGPAAWNEEVDSYIRTFPADSEFVVDRIYVRNGNKEFSSVTLMVTKTTDLILTKKGTRQAPFKSKGEKHYGRFWVKLADFNTADFVVIDDATISVDAVDQPGNYANIAMIKRRSSWGQQYWVKFVHPDPELAFEGIVTTRRADPIYREDSCYQPSWPHTMRSVVERWSGRTMYEYTPLHLLHTLVADSWKESTIDDLDSFKKQWGWAQMFDDIKHPLEDQLFIPTEKSARQALGIRTEKDDLKDIPMAGGKLSLFTVEKK